MEEMEFVRRILLKSGERNIKDQSIPRKSIKFVKDLANTMIEASWSTIVIMALSSYFLSWTFFAMLWYLIAWAHGDLNFDPVTGERLNEGKDTCLTGGDNFHGVFMLSMESQVSTGYGEHYPNEECTEAIFLLFAQLLFGVLLDGCMVGVFYNKLIAPTKHTKVVQFSKKAVICMRDGQLCLIFRVVDHRQHHGIRTKLKAFLFQQKTTIEGEHLGDVQMRLDLECNGKLFLLWPETVCHYINETSPFYELSAEEILDKNFEICISIKGESRKTGQTVQARTSYLASEILWGHRFVNIIKYNEKKDQYEADYNRFDETIEVETPLCSARRLNEIMREIKYYPELQALREYTIKSSKEENIEEEDEELDDVDDDLRPICSEETDVDVVEDMKDVGLLMNKTITRTTSVVQNYSSHEIELNSDNTFTLSTKSLTHIERERELAAMQKSRLRKYPRHDMKYYKSSGRVDPE